MNDLSTPQIAGLYVLACIAGLAIILGWYFISEHFKHNKK